MHCAAPHWAGWASGLKKNFIRQHSPRASNAPMPTGRGHRKPIAILAMLRQLAQSGACSTMFDALWTPLFLGVLFLVHPLLGVIGVLSVLFLLGLGLAEDWLTEAPLARSAAR